jgi:5-methylcytosine-specific restriction endonuclease McrA
MSSMSKHRRRMYDRDYHCRYCKRPMLYSMSTVDHVVARAAGGTNDSGNLTLACRRCNTMKGTMTVTEWLAFLDEKKKQGYLLW